MECSDARRLTGPNLFWDHPGAVLDVTLAEGADGLAVVRAWRAQATRALEALGLEVRLTERTFSGGVSLALAAPIDALYTATGISEWAFGAACVVLAGEPAPPFEDDRARLAGELAAERDPRLVALAEAAAARGLNFCGDDEWTTVGMGSRGRTWATPALPSVDEVDWKRLADVPSVLVTGTNGKTTTVRLLETIVRAAGLVPGASTTDWIRVGDELVDEDDWSGPGGARAVLKDERVDVALLETARGGLLRRGLALPRADVAVVTNVAADHLGEMGVHTLADLTEVKFIVRRAAEHLVLNADDPEVRRRGATAQEPVTWVSLDPAQPLIRAHLATGGAAVLLEDGVLVHRTREGREELLDAADVPITLGGVARYNVTNALCAAAAALRLGLPVDAVRRGLADFESDPATNPGRLNQFELGGVRALVDFAHNPHGLQAILAVTAVLPHDRMAVILGQAGDRDDTSIVELARITAAARPDLVVVKRMTGLLRGRTEGEVVRMIDATLRAHLPPVAIEHAPSELEAVRRALSWARDGDLLLLLCHIERGAVLELLTRLDREGWRAGDALPE